MRLMVEILKWEITVLLAALLVACIGALVISIIDPDYVEERLREVFRR